MEIEILATDKTYEKELDKITLNKDIKMELINQDNWYNNWTFYIMNTITKHRNLAQAIEFH